MPRMDKLAPYRTIWTEANGCGVVSYVRTNIVEWSPSAVILRTGGWRTVTTKRKMN
jgi:hypothetical protein